MNDLAEKPKGPIAWFAGNHVAANLLMLLIVVGGLISMLTIRMEISPDMSVDIIIVTVPYLGASPVEVEEGVCVRVEEAIEGIEGIKRLTSSAAEGAGIITIEVEEYAEPTEVLDDVKAAVDRIITFPKETEKPIITEITTQYPVMTVVIYGDTSERTLKNLAEQMRDDLTGMPTISQVAIAGVRNYEISIEVSEENLRRYGLTFESIASAVGRSSLDLPGGTIKTIGGEILIRTKGLMYTGSEFENIVVMTRSDGTKLYLSDVADVVDGFDDSEIATRFDGKPASMLRVSRIGQQDVRDVAAATKKYIADSKSRLPEGVSVATWFDQSLLLESRMQLLQRNAKLGLIFVFCCLALFLDLRLAFWTTMGIPISFMGAFWLMPYFDVSLNMISLFAFILALGIVVDDAIVVGENIFAYRQKGMGRLEAAILGVKEITAPVIMAVLTTMLTFMPLLYITGVMGKFIRVIPIVVISILAFSLVEALLILPAHLSRKRRFKKKAKPGPIGAFQGTIRRKLDAFIYGPFAKLVAGTIAWRYVTFAVAILVLMGTLGYIASGRIKFTMFPKVDADNVWASLSMPMGSTVAQTGEVVDKIEQAARKVREQIDLENDDPCHPSIFQHISTTIGDQPLSRGGHAGPPSDVGSGAHIAEVNIELLAGELRTISSSEVAARWREELGEVPGISSLTFTADLFSTGDAINVELSCRDFDTLLKAVERVKQILAEFDGVTDIDDSFEPGKVELKLALNDQGRTLGLTLSDLARQVRQGFYGQEVQRIQRGRNDIRVMVRYPQDERKSISDIENMRLRLPDGTEIPFKAVAEVQQGRGYAVIRRSERKRVVNVSADVDSAIANANEINQSLREEILPNLQNDYPGLVFSFEGEQREQKEIRQSLGSSFAIAMLAVFALLAVQFRSYTQPIIIMSAIPFGLVGAIVGHIVMGFELSILSIFGIVALTGVVVNDSLIIIDLINRLRREGTGLEEVMKASATRRFRPILLTTLTTFFGLVPMLMEKSLQARFLIPMAVSLAFGIVFATMITLLLVPSLYMILEDLKTLPARIFGKRACDSDSTPTLGAS